MSRAIEQERIVEVDTPYGSEEVHTVRTGSGSRRFLVWHGFNSVNRLFHWSFLERFGEVIRVGIPGHGPVARKRWSHYRQWSQERFLETGLAICRLFHSKNPLVLVGHSFGGHIALSCAIRIPEIVSALVLVNPLVWSPCNRLVQLLARSPFWGPLGTMVLGRRIRKAQMSVNSFLHGLRRIIGDREAFYANPNSLRNTESGHKDYRSNYIAAVVGAASVVARCDARPALRASQAKLPTLLIHGEEDVVVPVSQSEWLARQMPSATLIKLEGVGHLSYAEREKDFAEVVSDWLARNLLAPAVSPS